MCDRADERRAMVEEQLRPRGISDERLLQAFLDVPREMFVPEPFRPYAYEDCALRIEAGQTISQPYIVALMIAAAGVGPGDRVLEIGAGSGYAAAVLGTLGAQVFAVERHAELAELARARIERLGLANVEVRTGDGSRGWPQKSPFDAILIPAASPIVPDMLRDQLSPGGRLVLPVGGPLEQRLVRLTRSGGEWEEAELCPVRFVPLVSSESLK